MVGYASLTHPTIEGHAAFFLRMLEVEPGAERRARALQHYDTGRSVALQSFEISVERLDKRGIERVEAVRAIERDPIDAVMARAGKELEAELILFCRKHLSPIKCPKSIDFEAELPRTPTGKLVKRHLRDRYWPKPAKA